MAKRRLPEQCIVCGRCGHTAVIEQVRGSYRQEYRCPVRSDAGRRGVDAVECRKPRDPSIQQRLADGFRMMNGLPPIG